MTRLLLVDDEPGLVEALHRGFNSEGIAVDAAYDGVDGLWKATEAAAYDVIVLDVMMPGMSGYELLKQLRGREVWSPVLMLTAKDGEHDIADALDLGADDYLAKPFSFVVLLARVRALLRRGSAPRPTVIQVGDLALDPGRRRCWRGETKVELTAREFAILELLVRNRDVVLSRTEIRERVWDETFEGDSNVVDVYIGYLRRKIDAPFDRNSIVTVRGTGYCLDSNGE